MSYLENLSKLLPRASLKPVTPNEWQLAWKGSTKRMVFYLLAESAQLPVLITKDVDVLILPHIDEFSPHLHSLARLVLILPPDASLDRFVQLLREQEPNSIESIRAAFLSSCLLDRWTVTTGLAEPWKGILPQLPQCNFPTYKVPTGPVPNMKDPEQRYFLLNRKKK